MDQKGGKGRLRAIVRSSLLGEGLLERARATTLGLLGAAGAVGLAMVALVLNQGWPLVAGGPVPPLPPREQAVAKAKVVSASAGRTAHAGVAARSRDSSGDAGGAVRGHGPAPEGDATQAPSSELVVVPATPVEPQGDPPPGGVHPSPAPAEPKATPSPQAQAEGAGQAPPPAPPPVQAPPPEPSPPPPSASSSEAPESSVPPWSHGKGHAYGRSAWDRGGSDHDDWEDED